MSIADNVKRVRERMENACIRAGRKPQEITLIGVTKTHGADLINEGILAGITDIGENRVQEIIAKYDDIDKRAKIHLIGHLQSNKVKYIADKVAMIHSVDSLKLAKEISKRSCDKGIVTPCLVEVNIGQEESKTGLELCTKAAPDP